ncbi:ead/Ea22-like family protein [Salmonella enterica subsp. enterica]|nr:ead/Ea22-like family protein [Salmonella enterica subsp. enterica]
MTALNKQALREVATKAKELGNISRYTKAMVARLEFKEAATPDAVLALLDELEATEKRIAELERSETQLINERDDAESALNDAYKAVMGQAPEWSNWFSFADAIDEIELACGLWRNQTASARNEGINYAASRLAAAFNHGFVDKPLTEVRDVVRMILDTKEELANSTLPAADGISGEYAEKFLAEFAAQLQKGAAQ